MTRRDIAKLCHDTNRAYCQIIGDDSQPKWEDAPDWKIESAFDGVQIHLDNPVLPDSASHDAWMAFKVESGWIWGPRKNAEKKEHPCIVPFDQLPKDQQAKDALFAAIVRALAPLLDD